MRITRTALVASLALAAFRPDAAEAQDIERLVAAGQFQQAAEMLAGLGPAEADAGATLIFDRAYVGFVAHDYDYAIQGFAAARSVPGLSQGVREQLSFWHGLSLFQQTAARARQQDLETARVALPLFLQAEGLLDRASAYPTTIGINMEGTRQALSTFIEIQEAIIRRGY